MPTAKRKHAKPQTDIVIPDKIYFRIGEVSELANLPTYVLRFWETEFSQLKPTKSSTGQRMYRRKDVEYVVQIRRLLYEEGFTIAGAREKLREMAHAGQSATAVVEEKKESAAEVETAPLRLSFVAPGATTNGKEKIQKLRQQLCEVLDLLS